MADYELSYSADSIDSALGKVINQDATPTANSGNTVASSGVFSHVASQVATVNRNTDVDDLLTRVAALEAAVAALQGS